jgi:hypothetical protein
MLQRMWTDLLARPGGALSLRLLIQPLSAAVLGIIAGLRDAQQGKPAFLWAVFTQPERRRALLRDAWSGVWKIFVLAFALDVVFQLIEFRFVYPLESVVVATLLACIPYVLLRGPTNRIARSSRARLHHRASAKV